MFRSRKSPLPPADKPPATPQTAYEKTLARAFRLLAAKPRGTAQLRERLLEKTDEATVEKVIARLLELGYLNDEQFAASFARSRLSFKPLGKTRLRQDLKRQQLDNATVEQTLENTYEEQSEESLIDRTIEKRLRLKGAPATREESKKLFDYLLRRGFGYELVMRKVRAASQQTISEDE
jgi:regulatory protein